MLIVLPPQAGCNWIVICTCHCKQVLADAALLKIYPIGWLMARVFTNLILGFKIMFPTRSRVYTYSEFYFCLGNVTL